MGPQYGAIEKFEGKKVETLLKAKELWGLVSGKEVMSKRKQQPRGFGSLF
jgi:hypothetical protein